MRYATRGFTLIELLIVVVIIGILATVAIPKFTSVKEKGFVTAVKSDVRNLITAQESYFADFNTYGDLASVTAAIGFNASPNVTVAIPNQDASGWSATATHTSLTEYTACGVYVGTAPKPDGSLTVPGEVGCW